MNSRELLISGQTIDLSESEPIKLYYSVADVRDMSKRNSTYSDPTTVPATAANNQFFNNIFLVEGESTYPINKRVPAFNLSDTIPVNEGYAQLLQVNRNLSNEVMSYEVVTYGENFNLFNISGETLLKDLDWSELTHVKTQEVIENSWNDTYPFVYGAVDDGFQWDYLNNKGNIQSRELQPCIRLKYLFDKCLGVSNGYSYLSNILNTDYANRFVIYPNKRQTIQADINAHFAWTGITTGRYTFSLAIIAQDRLGNRRELIKRYYSDSHLLGNTGLTTWNFTADFYEGEICFVEINVSVPLSNAGNYIYFGDDSFFEIIYPDGIPGSFRARLSSVQNQFFAQHLHKFVFDKDLHGTEYDPDNSYDPSTGIHTTTATVSGFYLANVIPDSMKVKDILLIAIRLYNLYIQPAKTGKVLTIESREDFYNLHGQIKNWDSKFDAKRPVKIQLLSELTSKSFEHKFKEDKDFTSDDYRSHYGRGYGDNLYSVNNDFVTGTNTIEIPFLSTVQNQPFLNSSEMIIPRIYSKDDSGTVESVEHELKLMYWGGKIPLTADTFQVNYLIEGSATTYSYYPYVGEVDHPLYPTEQIYFGTPVKPYFSPLDNHYPQKNLFTRFYLPQIREMEDPNSKLVTAYFNLSPADIYQLDFTDAVFWDKNYYKINKVEYETGGKQTTKVELLKTDRKVVPQPNKKKSTLATNKKGKIFDGRGYGNVTMGGGSSEFVAGNYNVLNQQSSGSTIFGDFNYIGMSGSNVTILGGSYNWVDATTQNFTIINGTGNTIYTGSTGSVLIGVNNFSGTPPSNTVVAPNILIQSGLTAQSIYISSINGVDVSALSGLTALSALTGSTIIEDGINTFVGGTQSNPTVNVTGLSIDNLYVSGNSNFDFLSSGGTDLYNIFRTQDLAPTIWTTPLYGGAYSARQNRPGANVGSYGSPVQSSLAWGYAVSVNGNYGTILNGKNQGLGGGSYQTILNGASNLASSQWSTILNGFQNNAYGGLGAVHSTILGGRQNIISPTNGKYNLIGQGRNLKITGTSTSYSTNFGGSNYQLGESRTVLVPRLMIKNAPNSSGATSQLVIDSFGRVFKQSNLTGSSSSVTETTVSNGINTFTAGTSIFQSVNITGISLDNVYSSGNSRFDSLSAVSLSSSTIYLGGINILSYIPSVPAGADLWEPGGGAWSIKQKNTGNNNDGNYCVVFGENNTLQAGNLTSVIAGGTNNYIQTNYRAGIFAGINNKIYSSSKYSSVLGSYGSIIQNNAPYSTILNSKDSQIKNNTSFNSIIGSSGSQMAVYSTNNIILGGEDNLIDGVNHSAIIGGKGITVADSYTVAVPKLRITQFAGSMTYSLFVDNNGYVCKGIYSPIFGIGGRGNISVDVSSPNTPTVYLNQDISIRNIQVSGTSQFQTLGATLISGTTIQSGATDLYNIFATKNQISSNIPGSNITTGGTFAAQSISVVASPSFNNISSSGLSAFNAFSANTISGATLYSGTTNLYSIFATSVGSSAASSIIGVGNIITGGSYSAQTISIVDSPSFNNILASGLTTSSKLSASTLSASTINSGTTNLYSIFATVGSAGSSTTYTNDNGLNTYTGGTSTFQRINISGLTVDNIFSSGTSRFNTLSAGTLSGKTIQSDTLTGVSTQMVVANTAGVLSTQTIPTSKMMLGGAPNLALVKSTTNYLSLLGGAANATRTNVENQVVSTGTGTLKNLFFAVPSNSASNATNNLTLYKNGSATGIVVNIGTSTGFFMETATTVSVVQSDKICLRLDNNDSASGTHTITLAAFSIELSY